ESDLHDQLIGDGLVPLHSALGTHPDPNKDLLLHTAQQWIGYAMNHMELLHHRDVYAQLRQWLADEGTGSA
ncbi:MAG: alpha/beta hydrolase, partial [Oscillochloris sp.]|nr:alpha/beta hydrolase [Oscillochloris sp.]